MSGLGGSLAWRGAAIRRFDGRVGIRWAALGYVQTLWEMCGFKFRRARTRDVCEEIFPADADRVMASRILGDAKSPMFMLARSDVCDPTETLVAGSGGEYNESYTNLRFRVARGGTVCYINQVSERHCCRL